MVGYSKNEHWNCVTDTDSHVTFGRNTAAAISSAEDLEPNIKNVENISKKSCV